MDLSLPTFLHRKQLTFEPGRQIALRLLIATQYTGTNITVTGFTKDGAFTYSQITVGGSSINSYDFGISDIPVMISVNDPVGDFSMGDCYCIVQLLIDGTPVTQLCSGFVYNNKSISFPATNNIDAIPNHGAFDEITSADPAAGAQHNFSLAVNGPVKIKVLKTVLVTDANAANRTVHFTFSKNGGATFDFISQTVQTAAQTITYYLAPFGYQPAALAATIVYVPLPLDLVLAKSTAFKTTIDNGQVGDNFGVAVASLEEFTQF